MTTSAPTPVPQLAAIFLTHFDDTKGQTVLYYRSYNSSKLPRGTIEHTTLPSGLHLVEEDYFGFRHGDLPGVGLFRSRTTAPSPGQGGAGPSSGGGRGRRMVTLGILLADEGYVEDLFDLQSWLGGIYDRLEAVKDVYTTEEGKEGMEKVLDGVWTEYGSNSISTGIGSEMRLRRLADGPADIGVNHPIKYLPRLLEILGPQLITVYKAALTGRRILIYSSPPLLPISAFAWCISAFSLPSSATLPSTATPLDFDSDSDVVPASAETATIASGVVSKWLGQVGLMDLDALKTRDGPWVAVTSDKILLSHTRMYDLSIDLSSVSVVSPNSSSIPTSTIASAQSSMPGLAPVTSHVEIRYTTPDSPCPLLSTYSFSDIPLYKSVQAISNSNTRIGSRGDDWWITLYDLVDTVWSICAGVCEYAVGRGRVGVYLEERDDGHGHHLLTDEEGDTNELDGTGRLGEKEKGRMILRQLYHNTFHLHQRLDSVQAERGMLTPAQARGLVDGWFGKGEDIKFWLALDRHWERQRDDA